MLATSAHQVTVGDQQLMMKVQTWSSAVHLQGSPNQLRWRQRDAMPAEERQHCSTHSCGCHAAEDGLQQQQPSSSSADCCAGCIWLRVLHAALCYYTVGCGTACAEHGIQHGAAARQCLSMPWLYSRECLQLQQDSASACCGYTADRFAEQCLHILWLSSCRRGSQLQLQQHLSKLWMPASRV